MRLGIVGGLLQGTEAAYLASRAGYYVVVLDRKKAVPAFSLADTYYSLDVIEEVDRVKNIFRELDAVLPATENRRTLAFLEQLTGELKIPFIFDSAAYDISCSKVKSDRLFYELGIPAPLPWPNCHFPVVVKPSGLSGSAGVKRADHSGELNQYLDEMQAVGHEVVVQEFVSGPSLSMEVIALAGQARALVCTGLSFDRDYDCQRVECPVEIDRTIIEKLSDISTTIAEKLKLTGLMDVEVMLDGKVPKVIEIDARFPSQTPIAVYHATGINMVELLAEMFTKKSLPEVETVVRSAVILEHIIVTEGYLELTGEHVLSGVANLRVEKNFCGADEALVAIKNSEDWVATLIIKDSSPSRCRAKKEGVIGEIIHKYNLRIKER